MFLQWLFFLYRIDAKIIKNVNLPSCVNCKYYRPRAFSDFHSSWNECKYFGTKNIQTDLIDYNIAKECREDETKCGLEGKYFDENNYVFLKMMLHYSKNPLNAFFILWLCISILNYQIMIKK